MLGADISGGVRVLGGNHIRLRAGWTDCKSVEAPAG